MARSLQIPQYTAGTITIASVSGVWTVTGSGTNFVSPDGASNWTIAIGDMLVCGGALGIVGGITSATVLTLSYWSGGAVSSASSYVINRLAPIASQAVTGLVQQLVTLGTDSNPEPYLTVDTGNVRAKFDDDGSGDLRLRVRASSASGGDSAYVTALLINDSSGAATFEDAVSVPSLQVGGVNIGVYGGLKNRVINGAMRVAQTGQTSNLSTNSAFYPCVDGWVAYFATSGCAGFAQQVATSGGTGFLYYTKVQRTYGNSVGATFGFGQALESLNSADLASKTVTLSFYAQGGSTFSASHVTVSVWSGTGTDQSFSSGTGGLWTGQTSVISATQTLTTNLTRYSFTGTVPSNANQIGIAFFWTTSGTAGVDDSFYITGVQLEEGAVATPFEQTSFAYDLLLCQRFYQQSYDVGTSPATATGNGAFGHLVEYATNYATFDVYFQTRMRAIPTVTVYSTHSGSSGVIYDQNATTDLAVTIGFVGEGKCVVQVNNATAGAVATLIGQYTASARL